MKPILAWIKTNWLIVTLCAIVIIALPVSWFFSSRWTSSMRTEREKKANELAQPFGRAAKLDYTVPSIIPGVPAIETSSEPNAKLTAWFIDQKARQTTEAAYITQDMTARNQRARKPLVDGLFPEPTGDAEPKVLAFMYALVGRPPATPSAYQQLLTHANAGGPPEGTGVAQKLKDAKDREIQQITSGTQRQLTTEESARVLNVLRDRRVGEYQNRARDISVYATIDAFVGDARNGILRGLLSDLPSVETCFGWQFDYWVMQDFFESVRTANTENGQLQSVPNAPVKRIESIQVNQMFPDTPPPVGDPTDAPAAAPSADITALVPLDPRVSVTGRYGGPQNQVYDVRYAIVTMIVSSAQLPRIINAISSTNLQTVVELKLSEVDAWAELERGYYFGDGHVVRATMRIESVWLRDWTRPLMPRAIKQFLKVAEPPAPAPQG